MDAGRLWEGWSRLGSGAIPFRRIGLRRRDVPGRGPGGSSAIGRVRLGDVTLMGIGAWRDGPATRPTGGPSEVRVAEAPACVFFGPRFGPSSPNQVRTQHDRPDEDLHG